jgi:hypothetical protein
MTPVRIQRKRTKGWQMPPNTVAVTRGTIWGNPFSVCPDIKPGTSVGGAHHYIAVPTVEDAVQCFREMMISDGETSEALRKRLPELRGKNLACWCRLDQPCHADILLSLANDSNSEAAE